MTSAVTRARLATLLLASFLACLPAPSLARSGGGGHGGSHSGSRGFWTSRSRCSSCVRSSSGRIARSSSTRHAFQHAHPCPSTGRMSGSCPGYVIDHVQALKRGGADTPDNLQWQTKAAAKAKDKVE